ncbi:Beta-lactamase enzyme family protein [Arachidicoccus rhizosphaerae]|uniref:Beta-lactamase enzyme family protein n=1 Tax=Arachidicoccus rhizosphaerae TaxID=551991 RepID=A0A1H4D2Z2_9BACT|nr:serine hydrolase [Arachidicoccus rhizosphaerae]SEA66961.1 Beta-lactamase enzyme family protein [Arachidicoccus rhizosphaerae]
MEPIIPQKRQCLSSLKSPTFKRIEGKLIILVCFFSILTAHSQQSHTIAPTAVTIKTADSLNPILQIARGIQDPIFQQIFQSPDKYRLQILYTQINRDKNNRPHFTTYSYHLNPSSYFNPASTVKMPLSFLSLEKLHHLIRYGVNKDSYMLTDSSYTAQQKIDKDSTSASGYPSIAAYIKRIFLVSDNDAYNRLYEFLGQQYIQRRLNELGYTHTRINRRFYPMNEDQNRHTNRIRFLLNAGQPQLLYTQPPAYNKDSFSYGPAVLIGKGHMDASDSLIQGPFDFTRGNETTLTDLTEMLKSVLFPEAVTPGRRFNLSAADRKFLLQYMSQYPSETNYPKYDTSKFFDSFTKFFFRNKGPHLPSYVRAFNKPGWSYGFLTNVSYIADFKHHVEFMLSCTLYVNEDGIINDNKYDYDTLGFPFMTQLGQGIYQYELHRIKKYDPNLSAFRLNYEKRDPLDTRAMIQDIAD